MSEMCACRAQNKHVKEKDECVVIKTVINDFKVKMKLLNFVNLQSMHVMVPSHMLRNLVKALI